MPSVPLASLDRDKLKFVGLIALLVGLILMFSGGVAYLLNPYVGVADGVLLFASLGVMLLP